MLQLFDLMRTILQKIYLLLRFIPKWAALTCANLLAFEAKPCPQCSHLCGFSPVWVFIWSLSLVPLRKIFWHTLHLNLSASLDLAWVSISILCFFWRCASKVPGAEIFDMYKYVLCNCIIFEGSTGLILKLEPRCKLLHITPSKNNLFRKSNARTNKLRNKNCCKKSSSQLRGEHCKSSSNFFPSECPGLCST